jgi:probable HAF family extracellular repeat protein
MRVVVITLLTLFAAGLAHAEHSSPLRYRLEQLPHRPGIDDRAVSVDINSRGAIAGHFVSSPVFLWTARGRVIEAETTDPTLQRLEARGMNDRDQVVGFSIFEDVDTILTTHGFVWTRGRVIDIGDLPGGANASFATDINNRGVVVGSSDTELGTRAVLWERGNLELIGDFNAVAINDHGTVAGNSLAVGVVTWRAGEMRVLPSPSPGCCQAVDINNRGTVVGHNSNQTVIWRRGHMPRLLPNLSGWPISWAQGLNDRDDIVGRSLTWEGGSASGVATLWRRGAAARDLNELISDDDPLKGCAVLVGAIAINNGGEIAANGRDDCDFTGGHVYRLIPL